MSLLPVLEDGKIKPEVRVVFLDEASIKHWRQKKSSSPWPADLFRFERMEGKLGSWVMDHRRSEESRRTLYVGLGSSLTLESYRHAAAAAYHVLKARAYHQVALVFPFSFPKRLSAFGVAQALTEGWLLASYAFNRYKKKERKKTVFACLLLKDPLWKKQVKDGSERGGLFAAASMLARDLVNTPAMHVTPKDLADAARAIAKEHRLVSVKIHEESALRRMKAGGILAVGQGSEHPPVLVHLVYKPKRKAKKKIALIGKGLTFDSGGLSLKPADAMVNMKCDMAGAATVLGVFSILEVLQVPHEVHGFFAACENMPSGHAIRPGDIVKMMNGTTVEIANTDAEGRITLADTLTYAKRYAPDVMVDFATLTGACLVALGEEVAGILSTSPVWKKHFLAAAKTVGEKMWELPLEQKYKKLLESDTADLRNLGNKYGGVLTAGLFLEHFVGKTPWIHADIAGPAFAEKAFEPYIAKGGTGFGVRSCLQFLIS
jgi:leucyl aminopeptidase